MSRQSLLLDDTACEVLTASRVLSREDHNKSFTLSAAAGLLVTLPPLEPGLRFEFYVRTQPTSNTTTIVTYGSANVLIGNVLTVDVNSATDPDFEASGGDTFTFVNSKEIGRAHV
jgi:hypothetical protein